MEQNVTPEQMDAASRALVLAHDRSIRFPLDVIDRSIRAFGIPLCADERSMPAPLQLAVLHLARLSGLPTDERALDRLTRECERLILGDEGRDHPHDRGAA